MKIHPYIYKELRKTDILICFTLFFMIFVQYSTIGFIHYVSETTGADIKAVAIMYEQNPVAQYTILANKFVFVMQSLIIPGLLLAVYFMFRRKVMYGQLDLQGFMFYTQLFFFIMFMNFLNDITVIISTVMR